MGISALHDILRNIMVAALVLLLPAARAHAINSDPLSGDAIAPPPDVNIVLYYNVFTDAGVLEPVRGGGYGKDTHISLDIQALRYIRTFNIDGMLSGVQLVQPYVGFVGNQVLGVPHLPPSFGPGRVSLSHSAGFDQPSFGAFIFPVARPATGTYVVAGFWVAPPIGNYNKNAALNFTENLPTGELEAGARTVLLGSATGRNLSTELWGDGLFYGSNSRSSLAVLGSPLPARLSQQPSGEIRFYLPYVFLPATLATFTPGLYQSFGGKQIFTLANGAKLDAGTRTQETQLRFMLSSYLSPHWQVILNTEYDVAAHGGPLNRNIELRVATFF